MIRKVLTQVLLCFITLNKTRVFFKDTKIPSRSILKNAVILDKIRNTSFVQRFPVMFYD